MFVIACADIDADIVDECFLATVEHMPDEEFHAIHTSNYEAGAYWEAYKRYPNEDFFYLIHDSLIVQEDLSRYKENECTILMTERDWYGAGPQHKEWAKEQLALTDYDYMDTGFPLVFGSIMFCQRSVLDRLHAKNFHKIMPTCKMHSQAMERIWGIALAQEGIKLDVIRPNLHCHSHGWEDYPVRKIFMGRQ
jgi:hypothetical protein